MQADHLKPNCTVRRDSSTELNSEYKPIVVTPEEDGAVRVIGECMQVIGPVHASPAR